MVLNNNGLFRIIRYLALMFAFLIAFLLLLLLETMETKAQTCPPTSKSDLRCKFNRICVKCSVDWDRDKTGTINPPANGNGSGIGGVGCNCWLVGDGELNDMFNNVPVKSWESLHMPTRGNPFITPYPTFGPGKPITSLVIRYYPQLGLIESLYGVTIEPDGDDFINLSLGDVPLDAPGGIYRQINCVLDDCSFASILANLDSPNIQIREFKLPPLFEFEDSAILAEAQAVIELPAEINEVVTPEDVLFKLLENGEYTPTTQDFSQYCSAVLKGACDMWLNLMYPNVQYDEESQSVKLFPPGTLVAEISPDTAALIEVWSNPGFEPNTHLELQSLVNDVLESEVGITIP